MSFGSDSPGGSPEGIGGNESGIGSSSSSGDSGGSGYSGFGSISAPSYSLPSAPSFSGFLGSLGLNTAPETYSNQGNFSGIGPRPHGTVTNTAKNYDVDSKLGAAIRSMSPADQMSFFRSVVEPTLERYSGGVGSFSKGLARTVFGVVANGIFPGLGALSRITGLTGYMADKMMDGHIAHEMGVQLGINTNSEATQREPGGEGVLTQAVNAGKTPAAILAALNIAIRKQGGDMSTWDRIWGDITGNNASDAAKDASKTAAGYQKSALDYLQQREQLPLEISNNALQQLGGLYGLPGGVGTQQTFIDQAQNSPLYGAIMSGQDAGEQSILRNAGATGGLRSGNVQDNLYRANTELQNRAMLGAYGEQLGGLQYLAGQAPSNQNAIANQMTGIGNTLGMGQIAGANAQQQGTANTLGIIGAGVQSLGGLSGIAGGIGGMFDAYSSSGGGWKGVGSAVSSLF